MNPAFSFRLHITPLCGIIILSIGKGGNSYMNTNEKAVSFDKKLSVVIDKKNQDAFDMAFFSSYAKSSLVSMLYVSSLLS